MNTNLTAPQQGFDVGALYAGSYVKAGDLNGKLKGLARQDFAPVVKLAALNFGGAQNEFGRGEAERAAVIAFANRSDFGGSLNFAGREERTVRDGQLEAEPGELLVHGSGKIFWNRETPLAVVLGRENDDLGGADLAFWPEDPGAPEVLLEG